MSNEFSSRESMSLVQGRHLDLNPLLKGGTNVRGRNPVVNHDKYIDDFSFVMNIAFRS
jgi:hypothetical protein